MNEVVPEIQPIDPAKVGIKGCKVKDFFLVHASEMRRIMTIEVVNSHQLNSSHSDSWCNHDLEPSKIRQERVNAIEDFLEKTFTHGLLAPAVQLEVETGSGGKFPDVEPTLPNAVGDFQKDEGGNIEGRQSMQFGALKEPPCRIMVILGADERVEDEIRIKIQTGWR